MTETLLEVCDLSCERDDRPLFSGLNFCLNSGQLMQVAGANGAGKTTLLRILCGISSAYEGQIRWRGVALKENMASYRRQFLYLGHAPGVNLPLTPLDNLRWYFGINESVTEAAYVQALADVGLGGYEEVPAYRLSAGQQRRIALARLRLSKAPVWILDEPFTAIDLAGVAQLESILVDYARAGGSVILTTHHTLNIDMPFSRLDLGAPT